MSNLDKYREAFVTAFGVAAEEADTLTYQGIDAWDSVGHMGLISALEETFDIAFDTDDIIDFNSFEKGKEIMKKYEVEI